MSPAWSPDGQGLAYVSFEGKASAIYVQRLRSGERRRVSARAGINGAPAWSPDGRKLALTLSRDGNLDIYTLELATQALTRVTSRRRDRHRARVVPRRPEPLFHVGPRRQRAGLPRGARRARQGRARHVHQQLQRAAAPVARRQGTRDGHARSRRLPHRGAWTSQSRNLRVLTNARQDESPSFAPNGALLIYATRERSRGSLAIVSADGLLPAAPELRPGRRARAGVVAVSAPRG